MIGRDHGFTLIEVLVGLAFVSALVVGVANLLAVAQTLTLDAYDDSMGSLLAVQKIEQLRSAMAAGAPTASAPANALDEDVPGFFDHVGGFVRRWSSAPLPSDVSSRRVLQVRVLTVRRITEAAGSRSARLPGEARLASIVAVR